jgi:alpha-mannosidase
VVVPRELPLAGDRVEDAAGVAVPSQRLVGGDLAFLATGVPPLSGKQFFFTPGDRPAATSLAVRGATLAGADLSVEIDARTGAIASLRSRRLGRELVDRQAATAINDYFYLPGNDLKDLQRNGPVKISVKEAGPLVASLVVESEAPGCQRLSREVRLIDGLDRVEIVNRVDKKAVRAKEGVHFGFGFAVPNAQVHLDVGWAAIRPNRDQIPAACRNWFSVQRFVDVSNDAFGVTWAAPDAPIVEVARITGTLSGSPTNSEAYLYPDPKDWMDRALEGPAIYSFVMNNHWGTNYCADQQGLVEFRYSLAPHGPYRPLDALRFGIERSQPLLASVGGPARRAAGARGAAAIEPRLSISPAGVILTSLRPSRDGKAMIVRLYAASGETERAVVRWAAPAPKAVWLSDLTERPLSAAGPSIEVPAGGVVTLRAESAE